MTAHAHAFRLTGTEVKAALVLGVLALVIALLRGGRARPAETVVVRDGGSRLAVVALAAAAVVAWLNRRALSGAVAKAARTAPPRPVVTHVAAPAPAHPLLAGWQIVVIVAITLAVALVIHLSSRAPE